MHMRSELIAKKKIVNNLSGGGVHHLEYNNCSNMILKAGKYSDNFGNYIETYSTIVSNDL